MAHESAIASNFLKLDPRMHSLEEVACSYLLHATVLPQLTCLGMGQRDHGSQLALRGDWGGIGVSPQKASSQGPVT